MYYILIAIRVVVIIMIIIIIVVAAIVIIIIITNINYKFDDVRTGVVCVWGGLCDRGGIFISGPPVACRWLRWGRSG